MYKPNVKQPDRVILFEIGVILVLLSIKSVLNISYTSSFVIPEEEPKPWLDSAYVYTPAKEKKINIEKQEPAKRIAKADVFNPTAIIKQVSDLFKTPDLVMPDQFAAGPVKINPIHIPSNTVDTSIILDGNATEMPQFPGGVQALKKYILDNFRISDMMYEYVSNVQIEMEFVLHRKGYVVDVKMVSKEKPGFGIEQEAMRILGNMPQWTPAKHYGHKVPIRLKQPITIEIY